MTEERWLPVVGLEASYEVSDMGRVRSVDRIVARTRAGKPVLQPRRGKLLAPSFPEGYPCLRIGGRNRRVHIMVLEAFVGPRPGTFQGLHNNGQRDDCRLANLRWGSAASNTADSIRHGTRYVPRGAAHGCAKLDEAAVREIRAYQGRWLSGLCDKFAVTAGTIWLIRSRRTWRHVT